LSLLDIAEISVCLVDLGTTIESKALIQSFVESFVFRPGACKKQKANNYHTKT
jgi:hypothetical protein